MRDNPLQSRTGVEMDSREPSQRDTELRTSDPSERMNEDQSLMTRRNALLTIAAGATTALAGCSDSSTSGNSTESNGSSSQDDGNAIDSLKIDGYDLIVSLKTDAEVDRVRLLDQSDSELASTGIGAGVGQVSLSYTGYQPGEHSVVAVSGDSVIDEETITFNPQVAITDVGTVSQETPEFEQIPDQYKEREIETHDQVWISIENQGNVPATVTNVTLINPDASSETNVNAPADSSVRNLVSHGVGWQDGQTTVISQGETFNALTEWGPFPYETMCTDASGSVDITVSLQYGSSASGEFTYQRSSEQGDWDQFDNYKECPTSVVETNLTGE